MSTSPAEWDVQRIRHEMMDRGWDRAFVHEKGVRSAMIAALSRRWDAGIYTYTDEAALVHRIREFVADVMTRERYGDLPPRDDVED